MVPVRRSALIGAVLAVLSVWAPVAHAATVPSQALQSVVTISTDGREGSGFAFGAGDEVVTNQHVVGGAREVRVRLQSGRDVTGQVVRADAAADLAIVRIRAHLTPLRARATAPDPGEDVYALGAPLGLSGSVAKGIVSAVRTDGPEAATIQIDAAINPGNSGGPLIDAHGRTLGVVTSKAARGDGMGFAIPVSRVAGLRSAPTATTAPHADAPASPSWPLGEVIAAIVALLAGVTGLVLV